MNEKTQEALERVLELFSSGKVPEAIAMTLLPRTDCPSSRWSITNKLLMFVNGTKDARGIKQWRSVGRRVNKGAKAFYIICPLLVKKENTDGELDPVIIGFKSVPVFRYEDTNGKELQINHLPPPKLPALYDVAEQWGIKVEWSGFAGRAAGYYSPSHKEIQLCTYDEDVFYHELSHVAHEKVLGDLSKVEKWRKEVVAELTASVLGLLYNKEVNTGRQYEYIEGYADSANLKPVEACMAVIGDVSKCLDLILKKKEEAVKVAA